jgi:PAS domain S-box-containing protein
LEAVNPALCAIIGYAADELIGRPFSAFLPPDRVGALERAYAERFTRGEKVEDEYTVRAKDGQMLTVLSAAIYLADLAGRPRRAAFIVDIRERKREEQRLFEIEQQRTHAAEELAQMRSDFVSSVSHELRTPLTAIVGFAELLQAHSAHMTEARKQQQIANIVLSAHRQQRLVEDLLLLGRLEGTSPALQSQPTALAPLVRRAAEELRGSYPGQHVDLEGPEDLKVSADQDRMLQIVVNLMDNAAKYSPDGSPIAVTWQRQGDKILIRVRDHGSGVPENGRNQLFARFGRLPGSRIRSGRVGTGLGLYLGRLLARAMDGELELEVTGPEGSTFLLRLPAILDTPPG